MIPATWPFVLLALAAYRVWKLIAEDAILDRPLKRFSRLRSSDFVQCPWCAGFWIGLAWVAAFWVDDRALYAAVPFALSAVVGAAAMVVSRLAGDAS